MWWHSDIHVCLSQTTVWTYAHYFGMQIKVTCWYWAMHIESSSHVFFLTLPLQLMIRMTILVDHFSTFHKMWTLTSDQTNRLISVTHQRNASTPGQWLWCCCPQLVVKYHILLLFLLLLLLLLLYLLQDRAYQGSLCYQVVSQIWSSCVVCWHGL